jgi:hypothetical protein
MFGVSFPAKAYKMYLRRCGTRHQNEIRLWPLAAAAVAAAAARAVQGRAANT